MRAIGICRFSYPALGGFKRMHDTVEEREAYLYAPERMDLRFRHFETLTLPSIAAQKDKRFTFLVLTGERMPKPYWDRLNDICAPVEQISIVTAEPMKHRTAMQIAIQRELAEGKDEESLQFRLDDDDAVGTNFIRGIRRTARLAGKLRDGWQNMVIEYSRGYSVKLTPEGILAQEIQGQFLACGLAVLFRPGDPRTVMNYGHHKLHHTMPTLIEPETAMYLRALHDDNDSHARISTEGLAPLTDDQRAFFKDRFNVDEAAVQAAFSVPAASRGRA
ncbi:glycosyltransferase [Roseovarius sp. MMSF_3350]|uniref:glycosyltransferase n=1 Tax=Roseovarius sp. MMSF_3350 TaxID=3046706 RepID=UPI0027400C32|nr:glycosyltransferase [Roseovarius sp. MMSF_3350]